MIKAKGSLGSQAGLTITELLLVMGIAVILWAISTIAFIRPQEKVSLDAAFTTLVADIKSQQTKAMSGDAGSDYGIRFETHSYILFTGSSYNANDQANFTVNVDDPIQINSITLPNQALVLQKGSGEPANFVQGQNSLTLKNSSGGEESTIVINKYGALQE